MPTGAHTTAKKERTARLSEVLMDPRGKELARHLLREEEGWQDLLQDARFLYTRQFKSGAVIDRPRSYFFQIIRNLAKDRLARRARDRELVDGPHAGSDYTALVQSRVGQASPEAIASVSEMLEAYRTAVDGLPDDPRTKRNAEAFILKWVELYTWDEVAAELGVPPSTAKSGANLYREALEGAMAKQFDVPQADLSALIQAAGGLSVVAVLAIGLTKGGGGYHVGRLSLLAKVASAMAVGSIVAGGFLFSALPPTAPENDATEVIEYETPVSRPAPRSLWDIYNNSPLRLRNMSFRGGAVRATWRHEPSAALGLLRIEYESDLTEKNLEFETSPTGLAGLSRLRADPADAETSLAAAVLEIVPGAILVMEVTGSGPDMIYTVPGVSCDAERVVRVEDIDLVGLVGTICGVDPRPSACDVASFTAVRLTTTSRGVRVDFPGASIEPGPQSSFVAWYVEDEAWKWRSLVPTSAGAGRLEATIDAPAAFIDFRGSRGTEYFIAHPRSVTPPMRWDEGHERVTLEALRASCTGTPE